MIKFFNPMDPNADRLISLDEVKIAHENIGGVWGHKE